jgi:hypothetical protein
VSVVTESVERRNDRRANQAMTARTARHIATPWTTEQDTELLTGPGTIADRARRLGRTYYAASYRLQQLRKQGAQRRQLLTGQELAR